MNRKIVSCCFLCMTGSIVFAKPTEIMGKQHDGVIILSLTGSPYKVVGEYIVPSGSSLRIEEGVALVFAKNVGLSIDGGLSVEGTSKKPVLFKGEKAGVGEWSGIKLGKGGVADICGAIITGAQVGFKPVRGSKGVIRKSLIKENEKGVCFWEVGGAMEDCFVINNRECGVQTHCGMSTIDHCTITENEGDGVLGWGSVKMIATVLTKNAKTGICCWNGKCIAEGCIIEGNKGFDVDCRTGDVWDFGRCYWGEVGTRMLKQSGVIANLAKVKDKKDGTGEGVVDLSDFLTRPPKDCGAREYPGCRGGSQQPAKAEQTNIKNGNDEEASEKGAGDVGDGGDDSMDVANDDERNDEALEAEELFRFQNSCAVKVPSKVAADRAVKTMVELCSDDVKAARNGKMTNVQLASKFIECSRKTDDVALKFVLLRNAFKQLVLASRFDKARTLLFGIVDKFGGHYAAGVVEQSVPLIEKGAGRVKTSKLAASLLSVVAELNNAIDEIRAANAALKRTSAAYGECRRLALNSAIIGDRFEALSAYAMLDDQHGAMAKWELAYPKSVEGGFTAEMVADKWWSMTEGKDENGLAFHSFANHAAYWYRKALAEGKMDELKAVLVKKRVSKVNGMM